MRRNLEAIWMVARREFMDQLRDWRIVVPMVLLISVFPFIADDTTRQAVSFMNRFGGGLILDNLIPVCFHSGQHVVDALFKFLVTQ